MRCTINNLNPTFEELGLLMQHLSINQNKSLLKTVLFSKIEANSIANLIQLFEKLGSTQMNILLPVMEKNITEYLSGTSFNNADILALHQFLITKVINTDSAKKAVDNIFCKNPKFTSVQMNIRTQLIELLNKEPNHSLAPANGKGSPN